MLLIPVFFVRLGVKKMLAIGMLAFTLACTFVATAIVQNGWNLWLISIGVFVAAWIGQFYGHKVEGKKPSFFKDLQFLLIGPAWLLHFVYRKLGIPY